MLATCAPMRPARARLQGASARCGGDAGAFASSLQSAAECWRERPQPANDHAGHPERLGPPGGCLGKANR